MYRKLCVTLLLVTFLTCSVTRAHDLSKHKGKGTSGKIVSIADDRIELKTSTGAKTVTITNKTKFERGSDQVTKGDLKKGDQVTVFGTKLATGELVAREVLLAKPEPHDGHKHEAESKH